MKKKNWDLRTVQAACKSDNGLSMATTTATLPRHCCLKCKRNCCCCWWWWGVYEGNWLPHGVEGVCCLLLTDTVQPFIWILLGPECSRKSRCHNRIENYEYATVANITEEVAVVLWTEWTPNNNYQVEYVVRTHSCYILLLLLLCPPCKVIRLLHLGLGYRRSWA